MSKKNENIIALKIRKDGDRYAIVAIIEGGSRRTVANKHFEHAAFETAAEMSDELGGIEIINGLIVDKLMPTLPNNIEPIGATIRVMSDTEASRALATLRQLVIRAQRTSLLTTKPDEELHTSAERRLINEINATLNGVGDGDWVASVFDKTALLERLIERAAFAIERMATYRPLRDPLGIASQLRSIIKEPRNDSENDTAGNSGD